MSALSELAQPKRFRARRVSRYGYQIPEDGHSRYSSALLVHSSGSCHSPDPVVRDAPGQKYGDVAGGGG